MPLPPSEDQDIRPTLSELQRLRIEALRAGDLVSARAYGDAVRERIEEAQRGEAGATPA